MSEQWCGLDLDAWAHDVVFNTAPTGAQALVSCGHEAQLAIYMRPLEESLRKAIYERYDPVGESREQLEKALAEATGKLQAKSELLEAALAEVERMRAFLRGP